MMEGWAQPRRPAAAPVQPCACPPLPVLCVLIYVCVLRRATGAHRSLPGVCVLLYGLVLLICWALLGVAWRRGSDAGWTCQPPQRVHPYMTRPSPCSSRGCCYGYSTQQCAAPAGNHPRVLESFDSGNPCSSAPTHRTTARAPSALQFFLIVTRINMDWPASVLALQSLLGSITGTVKQVSACVCACVCALFVSVGGGDAPCVGGCVGRRVRYGRARQGRANAVGVAQSRKERGTRHTVCVCVGGGLLHVRRCRTRV